jgi:predicted CxxxxCH...CXXCH cytochrome family protein
MKKIFAIYSGTLMLLIGTLVFLPACSELQSELPAPSSAALKVHPSGWTETGNANFHGMAIRANNWDMRDCRTCHGLIYDGGTSGISCRTCHNKPAGPENCSTCHGTVNPAPPRDLAGNMLPTARGVGAHQIHVLGGALSTNISCLECHKVPGGTYDAGHVDTPAPAEVMFTGRLANEPSLGVTPNPAWNPQSLACSGTYCHGAFKNGNPDFAPVWTNATGTQAACGTCHGDPTRPTLAERALPKTTAQGGTHPNNLNCGGCHAQVVNSQLQIIDKSKHINGKLNVFGMEIDF